MTEPLSKSLFIRLLSLGLYDNFNFTQKTEH
jgi:hypothetical protein